MKKFFKLSLLSALVLSLFANVVQALMLLSFSDVPEDVWYEEAVYDLAEKGIIQGYDDGTFRPGNDINRAEAAVIMDRMYDYLMDPYGEEWEVYENEYYAVWYPSEFADGLVTASNDCGVHYGFESDGVPPSPNWSVRCYDLSTDTDDLLDELAPEEGETTLFEETFGINGREADHFVQMTLDDSGEVTYQEGVFIEGETYLYMIINSRENDPDFEKFYQSFTLYDVMLP